MRKALERIKWLLPEQLVFGQQVLRRSRTWVERGLIFIHIPKNGGTSINKALYGRFQGHYRLADVERYAPEPCRNLPVLAVTRNPWARLYSAWKFARLGSTGPGSPGIRRPWMYTHERFETFEKFVVEWLPRQNLDRVDYVFRPQAQWLKSRHGRQIDCLGRIEDVQTYKPWIRGVLGEEIEIPWLNVTAPPKEYWLQYNRRMTEVVADVYSDDLALMDYEF